MLDSRDIKEIEKLKDLFMDEISTITKKGTLTPTDGEAGKIALEALEKIECLCCMVEETQNGMSMRMMPYNSMLIDPYGNQVPYEGYAERRGRDSMGRYTSRRSYANDYARHGETIDSMIDGLKDMKRELENK